MNPHIPHQKKEMVLCTPAINYRLKSEVSITLRCQLLVCSTHYTAFSKSTSAIKVATMKNTDDFHYEESHYVLPLNQCFSLSAMMNGTQRRTLGRMHCTYYGMPKVTFRAKATSNSEKIKSIALAVIKLHLHQSVSQSVSQ